MSIALAWNDAVAHHLAGRLPEAAAGYRQLLALDPAHALALHMLGVLQLQLGQSAAALELIGRAIGIWQLAARQHPADPEVVERLAAAYSDSGVAWDQQGSVAQATGCFRTALALRPDYAEAWFNLGRSLASASQWGEAISAYERAIVLRPDMPDAHNHLGIAQFSRGQLHEAIASYQQALRLRPEDARANNNLAAALRACGRWPEAIAAYRRALQMEPGDAEVWNNVGSALDACGEHAPAIAAFERALAIRPAFSAAQNNLGNLLKNVGDLDGALAAYQRAIDIEPGNQEAHSNRLYTLYFHSAYSAERIGREHQHWNAAYAARLRLAEPPGDSDHAPQRRLRVGYVGAQFRDHCQALFLEPLWSHHDHGQVEVIAYSDVAAEDAVTAHLRGHCDGWRRIAGLSDAAVAAQIRHDQIDVLVDLTLHMAQNRLLVLARRPAPLQVTWLGYPGTTGLETIDYRLTDPYLDPPPAADIVRVSGADFGCYSEKSYHLPHTFWCYDPLTSRPPVGPLPALQSGHITFGCLNNFCKVTGATLRLWAAVMREVPGSRLLLLAPRAARQRVVDALGRGGVVASRLEFLDRVSRPRYLAYYQRIDIGLDTIPYNGHTTTLDALWMGVPVITLVGSAPAGRAGWSQLNNLGLERLAAATPEDFVSLAAEVGSDRTALAALRASLRDRLAQSPLCDGPAFARAVEAAFRAMWLEHVSSTTAPPATARWRRRSA